MANFCSNCGTKVEQTWNACPKCGTALGGSVISQKTPLQYAQPVQQQYGKPSSGKKHTHSMLGLIFGAISLFLIIIPIIGIILGVLAIIFSLIGLTSDQDNVMAVIGLIAGIMSIISGIAIIVFILFYY